MADEIDNIKQRYASEMGDLIEEVASGRGVLVHTEFLRAAVFTPRPQTLEELSARTREKEKDTQSRIQIFVKSDWMICADTEGGQQAYCIDLPHFLPERTDRMFDAPDRCGEYRQLLADIEAALPGTAGADREELEAMKVSLVGILPCLEERAQELGY